MLGAAVGRVVDRAPADTPGRPVPEGSRGGAGIAETPALTAGGGAPQTPTGLGGLRRPSGLAGRGLDLFALAVQGADLLTRG